MNSEPAPSKFAPRFSDAQLIEFVRTVAAYASPDDPRVIGQRAWSNARVAAGCPQAPRADKVVAQLNVSWGDLLQVIFTPERDVLRTIGTGKRRAESKQVSHDDAGQD